MPRGNEVGGTEVGSRGDERYMHTKRRGDALRPKVGTELEEDLGDARLGKAPLKDTKLLDKYQNDYTVIETKKIAEHYGGEIAVKITDPENQKKYLLILDKETKIKEIIKQEDIKKEVKDNAEKHAVAQHLKVDGLTIANINDSDIDINGNQYTIKDQKTGEAWLFRKDQLDKATRDKIGGDSDFGQRDPAKAKNSFPLSESIHQAVIDNAVEVGEVAPGSKVVGWSEDKWAIADEADGKIKIFDPKKYSDGLDSLDRKIMEDTELNAVKKYAKLGDKQLALTEVKFPDDGDRTKYKVRTADDPTGPWKDLEKKDIHSDILAKIDDERERIDLDDIKAARVIMGVKDWNDILKDKELSFEKARSIRRWGMRLAGVLEQANMAGAVESQSLEGAIESLMHMGGDANQNQPMTIEATHRLMKAAKHRYEDWKKFQRAGLKIIETYGPELAEKHGITKEGLETLDKNITRKFEQLVKKHPDAKIE